MGRWSGQRSETSARVVRHRGGLPGFSDLPGSAKPHGLTRSGSFAAKMPRPVYPAESRRIPWFQGVTGARLARTRRPAASRRTAIVLLLERHHVEDAESLVAAGDDLLAGPDHLREVGLTAIVPVGRVEPVPDTSPPSGAGRRGEPSSAKGGLARPPFATAAGTRPHNQTEGISSVARRRCLSS